MRVTLKAVAGLQECVIRLMSGVVFIKTWALSVSALSITQTLKTLQFIPGECTYDPVNLSR